MMKKMISVLLLLAMMCVPALGVMEDIMPYSDTHFQSYGIGMSTTSSGDLHITFTVDAKETSSIVGVSTYTVLEKIDGEWVEVASNLSGYLKEDTVSCVFSKNYTNAQSGNQYRVQAQLYVKKYDGTGRTIDYLSQSYTL